MAKQAEGSLGWNSSEILPEIWKLNAVESMAKVNGVGNYYVVESMANMNGNSDYVQLYGDQSGSKDTKKNGDQDARGDFRGTRK